MVPDFGVTSNARNRTRSFFSFRLMLYHERERKNKENANFVYIVYLLTKLCNSFDEAFFIDVSIHLTSYATSKCTQIIKLQRHHMRE